MFIKNNSKMETYVSSDSAWRERIAVENSAKYRQQLRLISGGESFGTSSTKNKQRS